MSKREGRDVHTLGCQGAGCLCTWGESRPVSGGEVCSCLMSASLRGFSPSELKVSGLCSTRKEREDMVFGMLYIAGNTTLFQSD